MVMSNWKKPLLLVVTTIAIAGIVGGTIYWYYAPYRNTLAFFPNTEAGAGFHLTECGDAMVNEDNYFRFNTVNHVFYYEYAFGIYCSTQEKNLNVSLEQDGRAVTLRFDFNYTYVAACSCSYKLNGYVAGLLGETCDLMVVQHVKSLQSDENATVGTFQVTI